MAYVKPREKKHGHHSGFVVVQAQETENEISALGTLNRRLKVKITPGYEVTGNCIFLPKNALLSSIMTNSASFTNHYDWPWSLYPYWQRNCLNCSAGDLLNISVSIGNNLHWAGQMFYMQRTRQECDDQSTRQRTSNGWRCCQTSTWMLRYLRTKNCRQIVKFSLLLEAIFRISTSDGKWRVSGLVDATFCRSK